MKDEEDGPSAGAWGADFSHPSALELGSGERVEGTDGADAVQGYSGHTHDTKVLDIEDSLRSAVAAFLSPEESDRESRTTSC